MVLTIRVGPWQLIVRKSVKLALKLFSPDRADTLLATVIVCCLAGKDRGWKKTRAGSLWAASTGFFMRCVLYPSRYFQWVVTTLSPTCLLASLLALSLFTVPVQAAVVTHIQECEPTSCEYHWPRITPPPGWNQDVEASFRYNALALAPAGKTFVNSHVVIYAKAERRDASGLSFEWWQQAELADFHRRFSRVAVTPAGKITDQRGSRWTGYRYTPKASGHWEMVYYGIDGEYFVQLVISARNPEAFEHYHPTLANLVRRYKH